MNFHTLICALISLLLPLSVYGEELNAGIVRGIWYSTSTLIADEPTRIYAAVRNNTESDLTGTVVFTDNGTRVGTLAVNALPGRIVEAWSDWKPLYGNHKIIATFVDARTLGVGEPSTAIQVESTLAEDTVFVDHDTDRDGRGNEKDTDDDNDDVSDEDEKKRGSDPLIKDKSPEETPPPVPPATPEETSQVPVVEDSNEPTAQGLERYTADDGRIDSTLKKTTASIVDTKTRLDHYREARTDSQTVNATTTIEKRSLVALSLDGLKSIGSFAYTFILFAFSSLLGHPMLVQILLLLLIPYLLIKMARRLARRPDGFQ